MSAPFALYKSVPALVPSLPIGAIVTVGHRNANGQPVDKDRFFIMSPTLVKKEFPKRNGGKYSVDARDEHPDFAAWNARAKAGRYVKHRETGATLRDLAVMRGFVAFAAYSDAFESKFWAPEIDSQDLRLKAPGRYPACTGNGVTASRFVRMDGERPVYHEVDCGGRGDASTGRPACPFYGKGCNLKASLAFFPCWDTDTMPRVLTRWSSRSPQSAENALGMLHTAHAMGVGMGIPEPSLLGLPFEMRIAEHTSNVVEPRRFPIVKFSLATDLPEWFRAQKRQQQELGAGGFVAARPVLKTPDEYVEELLELEAGDAATLSGPIRGADIADAFGAATLPEAEV